MLDERLEASLLLWEDSDVLAHAETFALVARAFISSTFIEHLG